MLSAFSSFLQALNGNQIYEVLELMTILMELSITLSRICRPLSVNMLTDSFVIEAKICLSCFLLWQRLLKVTLLGLKRRASWPPRTRDAVRLG